MTKWKKGDWAIYDRRIVQITSVKDKQVCEVSDGVLNTCSTGLEARLRPLTLTNKGVVESIEWWYRDLRKIRGEGGFNYPDISRYFSDLALRAIDTQPDNNAMNKASNFVRAARDYTPVIDGVLLFREPR